MLTILMKGMAGAALLGSLLLPVSPGFRTALLCLVAAGAVAGLVQAVVLGEYRWVVAFGVVACLFNPILPIGLPSGVTMILNTITFLLFGLSLQLLKTSPRLTIASITDRMPGSESL